mgnify:CR=1 FL=1
MVLQSGFQLVSKLKNNSALYLPWVGGYAGKGAPRKYGLKLDFRAISEKYLKFENSIISLGGGGFMNEKIVLIDDDNHIYFFDFTGFLSSLVC